MQTRLGRVGLADKRLLDLAGAPRQPRQRRGVQSFLRQTIDERAQPGACEARIVIGGVARIIEAVRFAIGDKVALADAEQGTQQRQPAEVRVFRHRLETADAGAAQQAKQCGLGLIVEMMGGDNRFGADVARALRQQSVARLARQLLQTPLRLRAVPDKDAMGHTQLVGRAAPTASASSPALRRGKP